MQYRRYANIADSLELLFLHHYRTLAPSIFGRVMRLEEEGGRDLLVIDPQEHLDCDTRHLRRDMHGNLVIEGIAETAGKHGYALVMDLPVMAWCRPGWSHVVIGDSRVVLWRAQRTGGKSNGN